MAGMFGKSAARFNPSGLSGSDKLMLFGAGLKDFGGAISGRDSDALLQLQGMLAQRQQDAAIQEWKRGLFGGQAAAQAPLTNAAGEDISAAFSPEAAPQRQGLPSLREIAPQLLNAPRGADIRPIVDILDKTSPEAMNVNGRILDKRDPNIIGMEVPETDKGQIRLYDAQGKFAGIRNADGYVQSAAELAGAVKGAEARAAAPYEFVNVPTPTGAPGVISKSQAAGQAFVGQSPTEAMTAKDRTQAGLDLPQNVQTAQQTLDLIQQLRNHPGRKLATGASGVLPGIPGTSQKDFITILDQAKGKAFLEAFASLKGGGQITEVEGRKATEAIARLDRTQSEEGFVRALDDLESVVKAGLDRSQRKAGAQTSAPPRSAVEAELRRRGLIR